MHLFCPDFKDILVHLLRILARVTTMDEYRLTYTALVSAGMYNTLQGNMTVMSCHVMSCHVMTVMSCQSCHDFLPGHEEKAGEVWAGRREEGGVIGGKGAKVQNRITNVPTVNDDCTTEITSNIARSIRRSSFHPS